MNLSRLIYVQDQVLDLDFCNHVIEKFEHDDRISSGMTHNGVNSLVHNSQEMNISAYEDWKNEDQIFHQSFNTHLRYYFDSFKDLRETGFSISQYHDLGYSVRRYNQGTDQYGWHNDFELNSENGLRILTFLWYLNDVAVGGETEFCDGTIIKPKAGRLLIFSANWFLVHKGCCPISNNKYITIGCLHGKNW